MDFRFRLSEVNLGIFHISISDFKFDRFFNLPVKRLALKQNELQIRIQRSRIIEGNYFLSTDWEL